MKTAVVFFVLLTALGVATFSAAAPTRQIHEIAFFIHVDLIQPGIGEDLAFWQAVLDEALAAADEALEGFQGPVDSPCCTSLRESAALTSFGEPGDGFDVVEDSDELDLLLATFGEGSPASPVGYIVMSLNACGDVEFSPDVLGCATTPGDVFIVDIDRLDLLGHTIAHERGHNANLLHPVDYLPPENDADLCRLMSGSGGSGCLAAFECDAFRNDAGVVAGAACECLEDAVGEPPLADGSSCDASAGLCSGGLCSETPGLADQQWAIGGGAEDPQHGVPDDLISMSPVTAGWREVGAIGFEISALVYDASAGDFLALSPQVEGNDRLLRVGKDGSASPVATLDCVTIAPPGCKNMTALSWGPGGSFLYSLVLGGGFGGFDLLVTIDPVSGAVTELGEGVNKSFSGTTGGGIPFDGIQSLAYVPAPEDVLYGSTSNGLVEVDRTCDALCNITAPAAESAEEAFAFHFGLEYDADGNRLVGLAASSPRLDSMSNVVGFLGEVESFDLASGEITRLEHQAFTGRSLAIFPTPIPEPCAALGLAAALVSLAGLRHRRRCDLRTS